MAEFTIKLDIRITPGIFRGGLAALLLSLLAPELATEQVTLTTYYPAPSGVYTNMITTKETYLARDGGNVGVGTINATAKLTVVPPGGSAGLAVGIVAAPDSIAQIAGGNLHVGGNNKGGVAVTSTRGYIYIDNAATVCGDANVDGDQGPEAGGGPSICGGYATFTPGLYIEGWSFQNRGNNAIGYVNSGDTTQSLHAAGSKAVYLNSLSQAHYYCCPKN